MQYSNIEKDQFSSGVLTDASIYNAALLEKIETLIQVGACYVDNTQRVLGPDTTGQYCDQTILEKASVNSAVYLPVDSTTEDLYGVFDKVLPKGQGTSQYWLSGSTQTLTFPFLSIIRVNITDSLSQFEENGIEVSAVTNLNLVRTFVSEINYPNNVYSSMMDYGTFLSVWGVPADGNVRATAVYGWYYPAMMDSWITPNRYGGDIIQNSTYHPLDSTDITGFLFTGSDAGSIPYFTLLFYLRTVIDGTLNSRNHTESLNDTDPLSYSDRNAVLTYSPNLTGFICFDYSLYRTNQGII